MEDVAATKQSLIDNADLVASSKEFQDILTNATSLDEIMIAFSSDERIGQIFNHLANDAEKYDYMLQRTNNELAQQKILLAQVRDTALEHSQKLNESANDGNILVAGTKSSLDGRMFQWKNLVDNTRYGTTLSGGVANTFDSS